MSRLNLLRRVTLRAGIAILILFAATGAARADVLPTDSGIVNVRDHGAVGDGKHDDTEPLRRAIAEAYIDQGDKGFWPSRIVYLPPGTYRVTDTLYKRDPGKRYAASMHLVGASKDRVTIKLDDRAPGYGNAGKPKSVIFMASGLISGSPTAGGKNFTELGEGNDAYGNYVEDITIDVGVGNAGAVAIDYLASNMGAVRNVDLRASAGSGHTGLKMDRKWPGPLLVDTLRVTGFATGVSVRHTEYGVTIDGLVLRGQREVGLRNHDNMVALRRADIEAEATAIQNTGDSGLVFLDRSKVTLKGARALWTENQGYLTLHEVSLQGGDRANTPIGRAQNGAYFKTRAIEKMGGEWTLPATLPPAAPATPLGEWANAQRFGAKTERGFDSGPAIQRALDSGAEVVYLPSGRYETGQSLVVPAHVRRIVGMVSAIRVHEKRTPQFTRARGVWRVSGEGEPVTIERIAIDHSGRGQQVGIEHDGARTLWVKDVVGAGVTHRRSARGGPLFLDNTCCGFFDISGSQGVWARQLNTEGNGVRILNRGAPLSILGLKVEQTATVVESFAPAQTEVMGGLLYLIHAPQKQVPAFVNHEGARTSLSYVETSYRDRASYDDHVVQVKRRRAARAEGREREQGSAARERGGEQDDDDDEDKRDRQRALGVDGPMGADRNLAADALEQAGDRKAVPWRADQLPKRGMARLVPGINVK